MVAVNSVKMVKVNRAKHIWSTGVKMMIGLVSTLKRTMRWMAGFVLVITLRLIQ